MENRNFLNAEMFIRLFLNPCEHYKEKIGLSIFEFSTFYEDALGGGAARARRQ